MGHKTIVTMLLLVLFLGGSLSVFADSVFTIEDPPVDFEVIDAEPFDGIGDNGPYATFNDALLGTIGEARSMAEFDISGFSVPPDEILSSATVEVRITDVGVFGLGVNGETPENLTLDGYIANGVANLSDFSAGDGNVLDVVATPDPWVGQIVSFDVTSFVAELVDAGEPFLGVTVRAGSFGGLMLEEGAGYPKLTIETLLDPTAVEETDRFPNSLLRGILPNPFTFSTRIGYSIPAESEGPILLTIHDATGRLIRTWQNVAPEPGFGSILWDGTDHAGASVAGGVYFCRLRLRGQTETHRMLLVR